MSQQITVEGITFYRFHTTAERYPGYETTHGDTRFRVAHIGRDDDPRIAQGTVSRPYWAATAYQVGSRHCCTLNFACRDGDRLSADPLYYDTDPATADPPVRLLAGVARLIRESYLLPWHRQEVTP
jgi:hypothetical protein